MKTKFLIILGIVFLFSLASVRALTVSSVDVYPSEIEPGESADVEIGLENNLDEDVEDVSVSLIFREIVKDSFGNVVAINEIPFAPYDSSSEATIEEIEEDKSDIVRFRIKALSSAESKVHKIPIKIIYYDKDGRQEKDSLISITVSSKPIMGASVEEGLFLKNGENEVTVKVINKGLSNIRFLEIEVQESRHYTILSPKEIYIGDIDSDDFDTADFKIYFKESAPTSISLPVTLSYKDALNDEYTEEFNLPIRVYTEEQAIQLGLLKKSRTTTYVVIVVVLVVAYFVYRRIKKRRKAKKAASK